MAKKSDYDRGRYDAYKEIRTLFQGAMSQMLDLKKNWSELAPPEKSNGAGDTPKPTRRRRARSGDSASA